ncbi:MAG: hypothetical protein AAGJ35_09550, partial [Myxococcota bacterium]
MRTRLSCSVFRTTQPANTSVYQVTTQHRWQRPPPTQVTTQRRRPTPPSTKSQYNAVGQYPHPPILTRNFVGQPLSVFSHRTTSWDGSRASFDT